MNQRDVGLIEPSVYRGFDAPALPPGMNLILSHTPDWYGPNGATESTYDETPGGETSIGVLMTRQGVVVKETNAISLPIAPGDATYPRIDRIVCRSKYLYAPGGEPATYVVYTGIPSVSPTAPVLSFPYQEILLGELRVPAGCTSLQDDGVVWTRSYPAPLANQLFTMYMNKVQTSVDLKMFEEIAFQRSSATTPDATTIDIDTFDPVTQLWDEANGTEIIVNIGAEAAYTFNLINAKLPQSRFFILKFTGIGSKVVQFHYDNFQNAEPMHDPPWNSGAVSRKHLRVYDGDTLAIIGNSSNGTAWKVLWHHCTKTPRVDRRLTMENSVLWGRGGVMIDSGGEIYFDWKANVIEIPCTGALDLFSLKPSDGVVQENILPFGYEIHVIPRYTGAQIHVDVFKLIAGGNIIMLNDLPLPLPWNRPFTLVSVPSPNGAAAAKWMLKEHMSGMRHDITTSYMADAGNVETSSVGSVTWDPAVANPLVCYWMEGVRCHMSLKVGVVITGVVSDIRFQLPPGLTARNVGSSAKYEVSGYGELQTGEFLIVGSGNTGAGNFGWVTMPVFAVFPPGTYTVRVRMDIEVFPSF